MLKDWLGRVSLTIAVVACALPALAQTAPPPTTPPPTTTPVPKPVPFPGARPPQTSAPAAQAAQTQPAQAAAPVDPRLAGIPIYPGAELLVDFDGGRGQRIFLLGTNVPYSDIVAYYKSALRTSGNEIFRAPATHQFDLGPYRSESMSFRPSVVVKDCTWLDSPGYLHVDGTTEKRFRTVIQIVPVNR